MTRGTRGVYRCEIIEFPKGAKFHLEEFAETSARNQLPATEEFDVSVPSHPNTDSLYDPDATDLANPPVLSL